MLTKLFETGLRRFLLASVLWVLFWPIFWFIKLGEITGPKAWFWIVGELSYPFAAVAYLLLDSVIQHSRLKPWMTFAAAALIVAVCMPTFYQRFGFAWGVSVEARYL